MKWESLYYRLTYISFKYFVLKEEILWQIKWQIPRTIKNKMVTSKRKILSMTVRKKAQELYIVTQQKGKMCKGCAST